MQGTRKERFRYYNSLVCLAKALEEYYTVVDLKNDAYLYGKIEFVDGYMNIEMSNVTFHNPRGKLTFCNLYRRTLLIIFIYVGLHYDCVLGKEYSFETFFVVGRTVRFIHIPDNCDITQLMENELYLKSQKKPVVDKKKTFKRKRAEQYHQKVLQEIATSKT